MIHEKQYHFGVYAAILTDAGLVTVRKSRGVYTGFLDLPGGRPEESETWDESLARETIEELGVTSERVGEWHKFDLQIDFDSSGNRANFHHQGVWCEASIDSAKLQVLHAEDVAGFEIVPVTDLLIRKDLSAPLKMVAEFMDSKVARRINL